MKSDLIILGGGIAGCMAALQAKRKGLRPVIIERRPFLGYELTGRYQLYIRRTEGASGIWKELLPVGEVHGEESCYFQGETKAALIKKLRSEEIPFFLNTALAGILTDDTHELSGVLLANSFGTFRLSANRLLDCSGNAGVGRMLGLPEQTGKEAEVTYAFEAEGLSPEEACIHLSGTAGWDGALYLHPSKKNEHTSTAVFTFEDEAVEDETVFSTRSRLELKARDLVSEIIGQLKQDPDHRDVRILNMGYETSYKTNRTDKTDKVTGSIPDQVQGIIPDICDLQFGFTEDDMAKLEKKMDEVLGEAHRCVSAEDTENTENTATADVLYIAGRKLLARDILTDAKGGIDWMGVSLQRVDVRMDMLPHISTDTVVAGLGASGICAYLGADTGTDVIGIENQYILGGTRTIGDVMGFYHGYLGGYTKKLNEELKEYEKNRLHMADEEISLHDRNSFILLLNEKALRSKGAVLLGTTVCGAKADRGMLKTLLLVNESGLFAIDADLTIDTTGNGDVAALAGCEYAFGDPDDGTPQTFSVWGTAVQEAADFKDKCYTGDFDTVDTTSYEDMMRAVILGESNNSPYYVVNQVEYREGRRIIGEDYLTLSRALSGAETEPVLAVAKSTIDSHGRVSSELARMGFAACEAEYRITIPMGCFIPKGMKGLLVGGKAISTDRDVLSIARMNADVQNAGYALGITARKENRKGRDFDYGRILPVLKREGLLPEEYLRCHIPSAAEAVHALSDEDPFSLMRVLIQPKSKVLPILKTEYQKAEYQTAECQEVKYQKEGDQAAVSGQRKLLLAKALAWFHNGAGREMLYKRMEWLIAHEDTTPMTDVAKRTDSVKHGLGDTLTDYWELNQLIILGAHIADERYRDLLCRIIDGSSAGGPPRVSGNRVYFAVRKDMICIPYYERIYNLLYVIIRHPGRRYGAHLLGLLEKAYIGGGYYAKRAEEMPLFFSSYLELTLANALYLCGEEHGKEILEAYASDVRAVLAKSAGHALRSHRPTKTA